MEDVFMDLFTLLTLAVGLAMDAFAVSICKGLAMREKVLKKGIIVGLWFGGFQALMPTIGFFLGTQYKDQITETMIESMGMAMDCVLTGKTFEEQYYELDKVIRTKLQYEKKPRI